MTKLRSTTRSSSGWSERRPRVETVSGETNLLDYDFQANQGPIVTIQVNGVKLSKGKVRTLVPVYEEGTVDEDLLNEGDRRIRDYYQREGYFDAQVTHRITVRGDRAKR